MLVKIIGGSGVSMRDMFNTIFLGSDRYEKDNRGEIERHHTLLNAQPFCWGLLLSSRSRFMRSGGITDSLLAGNLGWKTAGRIYGCSVVVSSESA